jgi:Putative transposase
VAWHVKILERYEHGRGVVTYLARYLKGGPINHGRLVDCRNGVVRFRYRDNRDKDPEEGRGRRKILPLSADQFLSRLLEHAPAAMLPIRSWTAHLPGGHFAAIQIAGPGRQSGSFIHAVSNCRTATGSASAGIAVLT